MLRHVALEIRPGQVQAETAFWTAIGFEEVSVPAKVGGDPAWLERQGTQIHLLPLDDPVIPPSGHVAVEVPDFEVTVSRLRDSGFEVSDRCEYWGAARAKVVSPGGHLVELMAAPPAIPSAVPPAPRNAGT